MKQCFIKKENNKKLLLFFAGWGSAPELFSDYKIADGYDCLLCYDYKDIAFASELLYGYDSVSLVAWSFGVYVADKVCANLENARWADVIAFGGTTMPIDDSKGIPVAVFDGTLANMSEQVLYKFRRRMCRHDLKHFTDHLPQRTLEDLTEELASLGETVRSSQTDVSDFHWTKAVAGRDDMIFPFVNQCNAWVEKNVGFVAADAAHYDVNIFERLLGGDFFEG